MSFTRAARYVTPVLVALALVVTRPAPASAQATPLGQEPSNLTLTAGTDLVNAYMFRGIFQDDTKVIIWPYADLGFALYLGEGMLKTVTANLGVWNSLNTGDKGTQGPSEKLWYEGDFYGSLGLGLIGGINLGGTYTAYTSPNQSFSTVKEIAAKLAVDDSTLLGRWSVKPYVLTAFELDVPADRPFAKLHNGQADTGTKPGAYLEVGLAPGWASDAISVAFPLKAGFSLSDYYELNLGTDANPNYVDSTFGYFSVAGIVTKPLGGMTSYGSWNIHGGVEFQKLGDSTTAYNGGEDTKVIGSFGIGLVK